MPEIQPSFQSVSQPISQSSRIPPRCLIFSQHGWADTGRNLGTLVQSIAPEESEVVSPSLRFWMTWLRIEPLIAEKEAIVAERLEHYPEIPLRVVAHSMGGLIWTELLHRHPEWWPRLESFVMVGSPIGGSDVARMIDPFNLGIGIARDLGRNRRELASAIAAKVPMLVVASDLGGGTDGLVTVECTKVPGAEFVLLPDIRHSTQRVHSQVGRTIQQFWTRTAEASGSFSRSADGKSAAVAEAAIARLRAVPGMTDAAYRDLKRAKVSARLQSGLALKTWINPLGLKHVFLVNEAGDCLFAGYVGWLHYKPLEGAIAALANRYAC